MNSIIAYAGAPVNELNLLSIDFNDKLPGSFIGEGGAELGEPVNLSSLTGEIIEDTLDENYLLVENNSGNTSGHSLQWAFLNNQEITEGAVTFTFEFTPSALERYSISVRENDGAANAFLSLAYTSSGTFSGTDAAGVISMTNNNFAAGETQNIVITFDMDAGTSELIINGDIVFTGRKHGITDRGVGRLLTGYRSSNNSAPFKLDNMSVVAQDQLSLVLDADFEDKVLGQPIGSGGANVGEPESIPIEITTEVIEQSVDNKALLLEKLGTSARVLTWGVINDIEFTSGKIKIKMDLEFDALDQYSITFGKIGSSGNNYTSVNFTVDGRIGITDSDGFAGSVGLYQANQVYQLSLILDMDAGLYNVLFDGIILLENRPHEFNNENGTALLQTGFQSTALINSSFVVDNLQIRANLTDEVFSNGFE